MQQASYRFFDAAFVLETDSPAFLAELDRAYGRFRAGESADAPVYRVLLAGQPECVVGGEPVRSSSPEAMRLYAYNALLQAALARVRSHWLLHGAAVVSPGGGGVIVAGAAGLGKTTLTLALLGRGFGFLSDDVAAIGRADGLLYPFPRAVGLRLPGAAIGEKQTIDVAGVIQPVAPGFLFVLTDPTQAAMPQPWYAVVDRLPGGLIADLGTLPALSGLEAVRPGPYPALRLHLRAGASAEVERQVLAACRRHGVLLFDWVQGREAPPDFGRAPHLEPLAASQAALEMLHHLRGGTDSALMREEFGGSASRLYLSLTGVAGQMACFRLGVGRLEEMVRLIEETVGDSE